MSIINRYLSDSFLTSFISDFGFLIKYVNDSYGELDLAIRDEYVNLYYRGNSIAKITNKVGSNYEVSIHRKFFEGTKADAEEYYESRTISREYVSLLLTEEKSPRRFLQKMHLSQFCGRVKKVNYGEEITFEQVIITDNLGRDDLILIDRQITDKKLRKRMDLLALEQIEPGSDQYRFLVIEVKLGNNPELRQDVAFQLEGYVNHIRENITDYQRCYELQYMQKKKNGPSCFPAI